jgi:hypothetical protein
MADVRKDEATEIRCLVKSKGGLSYEVILAGPVTGTPLIQLTSPPTKLSVEYIEEKLKAAEERRLSLDRDRVALLVAKMKKIEEASKRRMEEANCFISQKREAIERKMEAHIEKRESLINDLKSRVKEHWESAEQRILSRNTRINEPRIKVEENLKMNAARRNDIIKTKLDRLKEHNEHVQRVRAGILEKINQLKPEIQSKMELAQTRREQLKQDELEKLRSLERRAEAVRQNKERLCGDNDAQQTASSG